MPSHLRAAHTRGTPSRSAKDALLTAAVIATVSSGVLAQRQFDELGKRGLPNLRELSAAVATGDVDGDGDLDVMFGNTGYYGRTLWKGQQNRLHLNDGHGTYTDVTASHFPVDAQATNDIAVADVDGDGDLDCVTANGVGWGSAQNELYLNDGSGRFTRATGMHLPRRSDTTSCVAVGDVDGDGDVDLVFGNTGYWYSTGLNRLYLNDGSGHFTDAPAGALPARQGYASALELGDVDGDGDLDLVAGYDYGGRTRLFANDGTGTFTDVSTRLPNAGRLRSLTLGDVDGDGDLDLLAGTVLSGSRLYLNDGTGTFTDGSAGRMPVRKGGVNAIVLGDADGDGDLDIAIAAYYGTVGSDKLLYRNDGQGKFTDVTATQAPLDDDFAADVAWVDADGDGDGDLVWANQVPDTSSLLNGAVPDRLWLNDGVGTFADATASPMPAIADALDAIALGDVDGDGDPDLVVTTYSPQVSGNGLFLNDGTGHYIAAAAGRFPPRRDRAYAIVFGDVDGDGDLDVVLGSYDGWANGALNRLFLNDGTGTFRDASSMLPATLDNTLSAAMADVDGDGDLDLMLGNEGRDALLLNDGTGRFASRAFPANLEPTAAMAFGDVDSDGDPDLVCAKDPWGGQNRLYLNDGAGGFADVTLASLPPDSDETRGLALADVDADGDLDIAWANHGQQNRLYLNDGSGTFTDASSARLPSDVDYTRAVVSTDVDGDGDLDLVWGNGGYGGYLALDVRNRLYLNDGSGTFRDATEAAWVADSEITGAVAVGDVDRDGDPDVLFGDDNGSFGQVRLLFNLARQLDAPIVPRPGRPYRLLAHVRDPAWVAPVTVHAFVSPGTASIPLPPLGSVGIDPTRVVSLPPWLVTQLPGAGAATLTLPRSSTLIGASFYVQAVLNDGNGRARLSSVVAEVVLP